VDQNFLYIRHDGKASMTLSTTVVKDAEGAHFALAGQEHAKRALPSVSGAKAKLSNFQSDYDTVDLDARLLQAGHWLYASTHLKNR
jgi:hypothetical protein